MWAPFPAQTNNNFPYWNCSLKLYLSMFEIACWQSCLLLQFASLDWYYSVNGQEAERPAMSSVFAQSQHLLTKLQGKCKCFGTGCRVHCLQKYGVEHDPHGIVACCCYFAVGRQVCLVLFALLQGVSSFVQVVLVLHVEQRHVGCFLQKCKKYIATILNFAISAMAMQILALKCNCTFKLAASCASLASAATAPSSLSTARFVATNCIIHSEQNMHIHQRHILAMAKHV